MPDSIASALQSLMGFNRDPAINGIVATPYDGVGMLSPSPAAGVAPSSMMPTNVPLPPPRPTGIGDDDDDSPAPGAAPAGPAPMPPAARGIPAPGGAGAAMPVPAPAQQAPAPAPQPAGAAQSPPDMMAMYTQLLNDNKRDANRESGLAMMAGALSGSPEGRAALYNMAAQNGSASAANQANSTIGTLMQLRQFSQKQQQAAAQQSRLPAIAQQTGLPISTVQYLDQTGKLDEFVAKAAQPDNQVTQLSDGRTVLISKTNGKIAADFGGQKEEDKSPKQTALITDMRANWQKYGLPDPDSTTPADQQWWKDNTTRILAGGGGVNVNVNNTPEKAEMQAAGQAIGSAKGKEVASYIDDGKVALQTVRSLDTMAGALQASKGQYTGPFADYVLKGKQGLAGTFGLEMNLSGQETANKLGFQLATQMSKAISARPAQMEFIRALDNVPGILQTPQGASALISINKQDAQDRIELANLAHNAKPGENMNQIAQDFYKNHPIMSPFHPGEPFGQQDMNVLAGSAAANGLRGAADYVKPTPTPAAIADLKAHPEHKDDFEQHFGTGTSFHYLHGAGSQ